MGGPVEIGVDLYKLWQAGHVLLPQVGAVYAQDNQDIHNSAFDESAAFTRQGVVSPVAAPWQALRDRLETLFGDTAITLDLAGLALKVIAQNYANEDAEAAAVMQAQITAYEGNLDMPQAPGPLEIFSPSQDNFETETNAEGEEVPVR